MSQAWTRQMRGNYRGTPPDPDRLGTMLIGELEPPDPQTLVDRTERFGFLHYERGWVHGVWYCGTKSKPSSYWGQYPGNLLERIQAMFPVERMLHLCSGHAYINGAVNVDLMPTPARDVGADAECLPFADGSFSVVVIDPPYSQHDAERYGVKRLVSSTKVMREARRVLVGGGYLVWLDERYPAYRRTEWKLVGLIGIITGFQRRVRVLSIMRSSAITPNSLGRETTPRGTGGE